MLICKTNQGFVLGHTNESEDIIFDEILTSTGAVDMLHSPQEWRYLTKIEYDFIMEHINEKEVVEQFITEDEE